LPPRSHPADISLVSLGIAPVRLPAAPQLADARRMGISPDAPIDQRHTEQLGAAIREFETGNTR